jgi:hypothetical protein
MLMSIGSTTIRATTIAFVASRTKRGAPPLALASGAACRCERFFKSSP